MTSLFNVVVCIGCWECPRCHTWWHGGRQGLFSCNQWR